MTILETLLNARGSEIQKIVANHVCDGMSAALDEGAPKLLVAQEAMVHGLALLFGLTLDEGRAVAYDVIKGTIEKLVAAGSNPGRA